MAKKIKKQAPAVKTENRVRSARKPKEEPVAEELSADMAGDGDADADTEEFAPDESELAEFIIEGDDSGPSSMDERVLALWRDYTEKRTLAARDRLIEEYLPLVYQTAERMSAKFPPSVDLYDLVGAGNLGLIDAIEKFDYTRGIKFETYCSRRISGAMLDDLRKYDWVPRLIRNRSHQLDRSREELETKLKRTVSEEELAEHMDLSQEQYHELVSEVNVKTMVSLDRKWEDDDNELSHLDTLTDLRSVTPLEELERREIKNLAIRGLSDKEKAILVMYYYDNMCLKEIGAVLNISESRVCQIHQKTLELLREKFTARDLQTI